MKVLDSDGLLVFLHGLKKLFALKTEVPTVNTELDWGNDTTEGVSENPVSNRALVEEFKNYVKEVEFTNTLNSQLGYIPPSPDMIVQSDYNQNDSTSINYIKNRPFYTTDPEYAALYNNDDVITNSTANTDILNSSDSTSVSAYELDVSSSQLPEYLNSTSREGQTYSITINGQVYENVPINIYKSDDAVTYAVSKDGYSVYWSIGGEVVSYESKISMDFTSYPFSLIYAKPWNGNNAKYIFCTKNKVFSDSILSLEVGITEPKIVQIDNKYINKPGINAETFGAEIFNDYENNTASGSYSHVEGYFAKASGRENSHAEGCSTIAASSNQHVQGKYNIEDTESTYAHIVGNGTLWERSNAHTLDWSGNAWYSGNIYVGGTSQNDENAVQVATVNDVNKKLSLPVDADTNEIQYGTAGQVAVSDGKGGITWVTLADLLQSAT